MLTEKKNQINSLVLVREFDSDPDFMALKQGGSLLSAGVHKCSLQFVMLYFLSGAGTGI